MPMYGLCLKSTALSLRASVQAGDVFHWPVPPSHPWDWVEDPVSEDFAMGRALTQHSDALRFPHSPRVDCFFNSESPIAATSLCMGLGQLLGQSRLTSKPDQSSSFL